MDMFILAEITSKMDISGVWCLASILFLAIALFAYCFGPFSGSCTCLAFFVIAIFATGDVGDDASGADNIRPNSSYIANKSQTKIIERYKYNTDYGLFGYWRAKSGYSPDDVAYFIPGEEMNKVDMATGKILTDEETAIDYSFHYDKVTGMVVRNVPERDKWWIWVMKTTGKPPTDDDYYLYDETIDPINAPVEAGGSGVPQWVYHPASPVYIFGIGGLPVLLGGMFVASKIRG